MLLLVLLTCMTTIIVLIIGTIVYVISVLSDDADDLDMSDSLVIDSTIGFPINSPIGPIQNALNAIDNRISHRSIATNNQQQFTCTNPAHDHKSETKKPKLQADKQTSLDNNSNSIQHSQQQQQALSNAANEIGAALKEMIDVNETAAILDPHAASSTNNNSLSNDQLISSLTPIRIKSDPIPTTITNDSLTNGQNDDQKPPMQVPQPDIRETSDSESLQSAMNANSLNQVVDIPDQDLESDLDKRWIASASSQKTLIADQLGAPASKELFDDFDPKEIKWGGTGLHWCKSRKSLDKLIKLGVPLDTRNDRHETPLHVAIRRRKLTIIIGLLCHGAKVNCKNSNGETPLIVACKHLDAYACMLLLVFDANCDELDYYGQSARHHVALIAAKQQQQQKPASTSSAGAGSKRTVQMQNSSHLILAMLNEIGAKRCSSDKIQPSNCMLIDDHDSTTIECSEGCALNGKFNGNSYNRWPDFKNESLYKLHMFSDIIKQYKRRNKEQANKNTKGKSNHCDESNNIDTHDKTSRMLCIDGGGLRGIIVCQIMIEVEKYLKRPLLDYFDWVGGTSAGAFVSCALCTGMPLNQLRRICFDVKDEVFSGNKPYNSKFLEQVLKRTLGRDTKFSDIKDKKLAVTTVLADRDPCQLRFFRNYHSPEDLLEHFGFKPEVYNIMSSQSIVKLDSNEPATVSKSNLSSMKSVAKSLTVEAKSKSKRSESLGSVTPKQTNKSCKQSQPDNQPVVRKSLTSLSSTNNENQDNSTSSRSNYNTSNNKNTNINNNAEEQTMLKEYERDPYCWQAVRASAAAPFFFKPYGPFLDGGIISNNPTLDMMAEYQSFHSVREFLRARVNYEQAKSQERLEEIEKLKKNKSDIDQDENNLDDQLVLDTKTGLNQRESSSFTLSLCEPPSKLDMVVSLGTGRAKVVGRQDMFDFSQVMSGFGSVFSPVELIRSIRAARDLFKKLLQRSCQTEDHILDRAQSWCSSLKIPYFRINPPLANYMSIDDKRDEQLINAIWQAKLYMITMRDQLKELAELLDGRDPEADGSISDDDSWYSLKHTSSPM